MEEGGGCRMHGWAVSMATGHSASAPQHGGMAHGNGMVHGDGMAAAWQRHGDGMATIVRECLRIERLGGLNLA